MNTTALPSNALASSSSAYLRSAGHQPIDWMEFGPEAFERAKALDRPVLLDIGAVWCHWCHVIDRESYENPEIAALINENYVPVKVDRDQRPDVDARYQQAIISLTGHGGWPLTGFLTHEGRVIYGGTYFPPQAMKNLLQKVAGVYHKRKNDMFPAQAVHEHLPEETPDTEPVDPDMVLSPEIIKTMVESCKHSYDLVYGGLGQQPKFPHHSALKLLLAQNAQPELLKHTLTQMAEGGLYDQLAGGFHRYSVDREWHVPHFEKMAYDNAEALTVYSCGYQRFQDPLYKQTVEGILDWMWADLSDQDHGGFYASQDADIDLEDDGDHFTWNLDECREILSPQELSVVQQYYAMDARGDMHDRPGRNVLRVACSVEQLAQWIGMDLAETGRLLSDAQGKMREARARRPVPFIDTTVYTNWSAMLLCGQFEALQIQDLNSERLTRTRIHAFKTLDRLLADFVERDAAGMISQVLHTTGISGFLEDVAWLLNATIAAYSASLDTQYLQKAQQLADWLLTRFEDTQNGGFWDTPIPAEDAPDPLGLLAMRRKPAEDNPSSSANAIAIQGLLQLSMLVDAPDLQARYRASAEKALQFLIPRYARYGYYTAALGFALQTWLEPPLKLVMTGQSDELLLVARSVFSPGKLVKQVEATEGQPPSIQVCLGTRCWPPMSEPDALLSLLTDILP